jgi:hypothetical protein
LGKEQQALRARKPLLEPRAAIEHSELLVNAAGLKVSLQLPPCMKAFMSTIEGRTVPVR